MSKFRDQLNKIRESAVFSERQLYLVEAINNDSGFLLGQDKLYFASKNKVNESDSITTLYLSLRTNVFVNTVENSPSFEPGNYDLLIYWCSQI